MKSTLRSSGYTNVDKIGNEDLFPDEGYQFPPMPYSKQTRNYGCSTLFPLNQRINSQAITKTHTVTRSLDDRPPSPVIDPPMKQVRQGRRKLITEATINTRAKQVQYNDRMRDYNMNQQDTNAELEDEEIRLVKEQVRMDNEEKRRGRKELAAAYEGQLVSVEQRKQRERDEERAYELMLKQQDQKIAAEEEAKREKMRQIQRERREEYNKKNNELLQARKKRIENERAEEKLLQLESAEIEKRKDERAAEDERRRIEKTKLRARVCDEQAKNLEKLKDKHAEEQSAAESATAKAAQIHLMQMKEKAENMERERHQEWITLQKEREARRRSYSKKPFPKKLDELDQMKFEEEQKKRENKFYRSCQLKQVEERRQRELAEKEQELEDDKKMIEMTQTKFNAQLQKLQTLVPPELGITVPEYRPGLSFSRSVQ